MQQYRLCGEDAIYLIFWIAPFHFRAGIKRVSIYASGAGRKLKCFTDWNGKEIVQASLKAARYYPSVSPTNLCEEKLIYALFFPGKAAFSVDNFFLKFDFQQVWNFSIWFPDQKRKRSGKRPLRYWGVVSEISQNVQISYFLILFPNEKISISFPLNCYMFNKLDHKSHPTFLFNFLEAHEIFG